MLRTLASLRALAPASSSAWSTGAVVSGARPFGFGSHRSGNDPETLEKEKDKQVRGAAGTKSGHSLLMNVLKSAPTRLQPSAVLACGKLNAASECKTARRRPIPTPAEWLGIMISFE